MLLIKVRENIKKLAVELIWSNLKHFQTSDIYLFSLPSACISSSSECFFHHLNIVYAIPSKHWMNQIQNIISRSLRVLVWSFHKFTHDNDLLIWKAKQIPTQRVLICELNIILLTYKEQIRQKLYLACSLQFKDDFAWSHITTNYWYGQKCVDICKLHPYEILPQTVATYLKAPNCIGRLCIL